MSSTNEIAPMAVHPNVVKLHNMIKSDNPESWDEAWKAEVTPWVPHEDQPPLRDLIKSRVIDFPRQGRSFVPGCGAAQDAVFIATELNLNTLGLDISEIAIERANSLLSNSDIPTDVKVKFEKGDFFDFKVADPSDRFVLVYDYTFFVAIPPARRGEWGKQMTSLIKPGGYLITLVWPIDPETDAGPPFYVRVEHYEEVLNGGFEKVYDEVPERSSPNHVGKERIVVWKRRQ